MLFKFPDLLMQRLPMLRSASNERRETLIVKHNYYMDNRMFDDNSNYKWWEMIKNWQTYPVCAPTPILEMKPALKLCFGKLLSL